MTLFEEAKKWLQDLADLKAAPMGKLEARRAKVILTNLRQLQGEAVIDAAVKAFDMPTLEEAELSLRLKKIEAVVDKLQDKLSQSRADQDKLKEVFQHAMNLLAVMHGDGGHYVEKHGLKKACEDAEKIHHELVRALDEAEFNRDNFKKELETLSDEKVH